MTLADKELKVKAFVSKCRAGLFVELEFCHKILYHGHVSILFFAVSASKLMQF